MITAVKNESYDVKHDNRDNHVISVLRNAHESQSHLISLADQKANILIGIMAVTLSIFCTNAKFLISLDSRMLILFVCFLLMAVITILLALLVLLPKIKSSSGSSITEGMKNPLFIGFFTKFTQDEYVAYLSGKMNDDQSAKAILIGDIYQVGVVLRKKYLLLKYAYIFTLISIVLLVVFFVFVLVIG